MAALMSNAHRPRPTRTVHLAGREIVAPDDGHRLWSDLHHRALTIGWPRFFATAAAVFLVFNLVFATLYFVGGDPIANVSPGSFLGLYYFSIETLATVGYGDMHPQTDYGHLVATVEIFTGMSLMAVMTGLIFTRFSQPRARFVFTRHVVVTDHDGVPTLMVRLANARGNSIAGATAKLWLVRNEVSREGAALRRFHELRLQRQENPTFALSWTLLHDLDAASPLYGASAADLAESDAALIVTVAGIDENTAQQLNARNTWRHGDIRWAHRFADILLVGDDGRIILDYRCFNAVVADGATADPAACDGLGANLTPS